MSTDHPQRESMSIEEATIYNIWEIAANGEVFSRRWCLTRSPQEQVS
jgi:hypothetical protein